MDITRSDDRDRDGADSDGLLTRRSLLAALGLGTASAVGAAGGAIGLGSAQIEDGAETHEIIISDPDGGDLNDYSFVVSGQVERLESPRGDDVSADGTEASGTVAGGRDGYRYTGEILSFSYQPVIEVTIDGASVDPATLGEGDLASPDEGITPQEIVISDPDGSDSNDYRFTVSGQVSRLDDPRGDDVSADGTEASGTVAGGQDGYSFTGSILRFEYEGDIEVRIGGELVDPATLGEDDEEVSTPEDLTTELRITAVGESASYEFTVSDELVAGEDFDPGTDSISGVSASGTIGGRGSDNYFYSGAIAEFDLTGPAEVFIAGEQVDPDSLGADEPGAGTGEEHYLRVEAVGESARIELSVSGSIRAGERFDPGTDSISGSSATLTIGGRGVDDLYYTGSITDWDLTGPADVFIDGQQVDEDDPTAAGDTERYLRVNAVGESARIELSVSGSIRAGEDFDPGTDSISGSSAVLTIGGRGSDDLYYTGSITDWDLTGPAEVFIDGQQVDEDDPRTGGDAGGAEGNGRALFIFDDGDDSALLRGKPILDEFGYDGVVAIITGRVGTNTASSYLTFDQIERLDDAGWEIASHTVDHDLLTVLPESEWKAQIRESAEDLEEWGYASNAIVYPRQGGSSEIAAYASRYYEIGFGAGGERPPNFASQLEIGRYRSHEPEEVYNAIERESAVDGTVPIMLHDIVESDPIANETTERELRSIARAVEDAGMDVLTATEYARTL